MRRAPVAILVLTVASSTFAAAETQRRPGPREGRRLGLAESIRRAQEAHPDLGVPRAKIARAEAELARAKAARWPTGEVIDAFGIAPGARVGQVPNGLPQELAPLFSPDTFWQFDRIGFFNRLEIQANQPLYTFGRIAAGIDSAQLGIEARTADLERHRAKVVLETKRTWWGYKLARASAELLTEIESGFAEALAKATERLHEGEAGVTQTDVLKLQLALSETRRNLLKAEKEQEVALRGFRRAIGADEPVLPDDAALAPIELPDALWLDDEDPLEVTRRRPEWVAAEAGLGAQRRKVDLERAAFLPSVGVSGILRWAVTPGRDNITNPFLWDEFNLFIAGVFLGVKGTLEFGAIAAKVKEAEADVAERVAELEAARVGLPLELAEARLELAHGRRVLALAAEERKAGRSLAMLTLANFRLGIGEAHEVLEAVGFWGRAQAAWHTAVHDFNVGVAKLSRVLGRELDPALAETR